MRPLYKLGNAAVVALPSPQHDAAHCATRSAHMPQGGVFTLPSEFLLPAGRETSASLLPGEHLRHTLSRRSTTHTLAAVDPALALPTGDLAEAPRLGQDWSPCAASVVICRGHFLLPIHVSHSTASRGGTSEPQRVPVHSFSSYPLPCRARSRAGPFGLGPPSRPHLCGACTWQRRYWIHDPIFFTLSTAPRLRRAHPSPGLGLLITASRSAHL